MCKQDADDSSEGLRKHQARVEEIAREVAGKLVAEVDGPGPYSWGILRDVITARVEQRVMGEPAAVQRAFQRLYWHVGMLVRHDLEDGLRRAGRELVDRR